MSAAVLAEVFGEGRVRLLAQPPARSHLVQFYEDDAHLFRVVGDYLGAGLGGGEILLIIATEAHRRGFCDLLRAAGHDVGEAISAGRLLMVDAGETLAQFMVQGTPDRERFQAVTGGLLQQLQARACHAPVRAYGEMVDLLWQDGNASAAIKLEELWNELGQVQPFTLLCAYTMSHFRRESDGDPFQRVCGAHSHVIPVEPESSDPHDMMREISLLQQRARALETEIDHRKELEAALRDTLAARRRAEEDLRAQNEELARTVRFSEMFVGILGHDLRNPLSAITTAASLLLRRADSDAVARPAGRILSSGKRMARMINQLLDFTRIRLGKGLPLSRHQMDLGELCRMVMEESLAGHAASRIELQTSGELSGWWDGDRLSQLMSNLLGNALAHGEAERPVIVRLDGEASSEVAVEVHNQGVIPAEVLALLFDPGRSAAGLNRAGTAGLGLGLYISHEIVTAHAGTIQVASAPSDGTRFTVTLPRSSDPVLLR
jgi:signal transduction histidine kinase